jgi:hypothetical protein
MIFSACVVNKQNRAQELLENKRRNIRGIKITLAEIILLACFWVHESLQSHTHIMTALHFGFNYCIGSVSIRIWLTVIRNLWLQLK